jgi:general secretion pathway protein L
LLEAARTQLRNHATKPGPLWLCPSAASVLRTTLALPAAVEENLAEVLCFELDRRTPFSAVDAYFAYRIVSRDRGRGYIQVELAVTPRRLVANALLVAVRLGLAVGAIDLSSEAGAGELLTGVEGDGRSATDSRRIRAMRWCVAVSVLSVAIVAGAVPILRSFDQIADLGHQIVNARAAAENAADLEDEIARLSGDTAFLVGRKRDDTTAIRILAELTARLPDGTWLEDFSLDATDITFTGYSDSSSGLIPRLTQSKLLSDPRFQSPVTVDAASRRERFDITAHRATKGAPPS